MFDIVAIFSVVGISVASIVITISRYFFRRRKVENELIELVFQNQCEYTVLDVRSRDDYLKSHVDTALNVPYPDSKHYYPTENMFEKIIIYGENNYMARSTAKALSRNGYFNISCLGTYRFWENYKKKSTIKK